MPSPFAHLTAGYLVAHFAGDKLPLGGQPRSGVLLRAAILGGISLLPDLDAVPGLLVGDIGRYHNNASHSLLAGGGVALLAGLLAAALLGGRRKAAWLAWSGASLTAYLLHVSMDLFTGERGVLLLWPLPVRFTAPFKLFYGVQWGLGWISAWHLWTLFTEFLFFAGLFLLLKLAGAINNRFFHNGKNKGKIQ